MYDPRLAKSAADCFSGGGRAGQEGSLRRSIWMKGTQYPNSGTPRITLMASGKEEEITNE